MNSFSSSDRKGFDIWISNRLDEKYSWEEIENLCSEEEDFKSALDDLIETEMWPEELTHSLLTHNGSCMWSIIRNYTHLLF